MTSASRHSIKDFIELDSVRWMSDEFLTFLIKKDRSMWSYRSSKFHTEDEVGYVDKCFELDRRIYLDEFIDIAQPILNKGLDLLRDPSVSPNSK